MPPSIARSATAFAAAAAVIAFALPAAAFDFNNPTDKRAYCQMYAKQALNDVQSSQNRGCSYSGIAWSIDFNEQFGWCMSQSDIGTTTQQNLTRSTAVEQCGAGANPFPPVIADTPLDTASTFPPVVSSGSAEATTFPPVIAGDTPQVADAPAPQAASFPPVVASSGSRSSGSRSRSGRSAQVSFPPVVGASDVTAEGDAGDITETGPFVDRSERIREVAERMIEFGREHEVEIREAAHKLKKKVKQKLSNLREHSGSASHNENSLRSKVKGAIKEGLMRRLANR